jgi:hypothetical protein
MRDMDRDIRPGEGMLRKLAAELPEEKNSSRVELLCREVVVSLLEYSGSMEKDRPDASVTYGFAKDRFESALRKWRSARCETPSDGRAKCLTVAALGDWFHEDDDRWRGIAQGVIAELIRLLPVSASANGGSHGTRDYPVTEMATNS